MEKYIFDTGVNQGTLIMCKSSIIWGFHLLSVIHGFVAIDLVKVSTAPSLDKVTRICGSVPVSSLY